MAYTNIIASVINQKRTKFGWTKTELSKRTGISVQYLCDIETARRRPSIDILVVLAKTLEFSLDDIFLNKEITQLSNFS